MSEYEVVRRGKLVLKGETSKAKKRKHKKDKKDKGEKPIKKIVDDDALKHGGWWKATKFEDITGSVAIEYGEKAYITALDNGLFSLGAPHNDGDGPSPEEIFTAFPINDARVAFKSGYGKYLKVEKDGMITGRSDAVSTMEQFEPVFQDGKLALQAGNSCFVSVDPEDDAVVALRKKAGEGEVVVIRACAVREQNADDGVPTEEKGNLEQVEINYVELESFMDDIKVILKSNRYDVNELPKDIASHKEMEIWKEFLHDKLSNFLQFLNLLDDTIELKPQLKSLVGEYCRGENYFYEWPLLYASASPSQISSDPQSTESSEASHPSPTYNVPVSTPNSITKIDS